MSLFHDISLFLHFQIHPGAYFISQNKPYLCHNCCGLEFSLLDLTSLMTGSVLFHPPCIVLSVNHLTLPTPALCDHPDSFLCLNVDNYPNYISTWVNKWLTMIHYSSHYLTHEHLLLFGWYIPWEFPPY